MIHNININTPIVVKQVILQLQITHIQLSLKKIDQTIVGAFLNATDKDGLYTSVGQLFDWGFENFKTEKVISKGDKLDDYSIDDSTSIPLLSTEDFYYTFNLSEGEDITNSNISVEYDNKDLTTTSIKEG